jgi:hypothetical protein
METNLMEIGSDRYGLGGHMAIHVTELVFENHET